MNLRLNRLYLVTALLIALLTLGVAGVAAVPGDYTAVYVSPMGTGTTEDGLAYQPGDILASDGPGQPWYTYFDAEAHGLAGRNINAFDLKLGPSGQMDAADQPIYMSFSQPRVRLPDGAGTATANDIVAYTPLLSLANGGSFEILFDGSDVGLTTRSEQIDSLSVWLRDDVAANDIDVPFDCTAGILFITTAANYRVPGANGASLPGKGGDILAFCATNLGPDTAGYWFRAYNAAEEGLKPLRAFRNLSLHGFEYHDSTGEWDLLFSFSARTDFQMGAFSGYANNVYLVDTWDDTTTFQVDLNVDYPILNSIADGLEIEPYLSVCANDC